MDSRHKARPKTKGILRHSIRAPKPTEFEMFKMPKSSAESRGVVIAIEETIPSEFVLSAPPKAYIPRIQTSETALNPDRSRGSDKAQEEDDQRASANRLPPPALPGRASSSTEERSPSRSHTNSPDHVQDDSVTSKSPHSPVMRSIFPRYNPKVPLAKQHYYPNIESGQGSANGQTEARSSASARSPSRLKTLNSTFPKTEIEGIGSVLNRTDENLYGTSSSRPAPTLSTPEELLDLWSVANGQGSQEAADTYTLGLSCPELTLNHETISFTSSNSQSLYTLEAEQNNLTISRSHPINPSTTIYVSAPTISSLTPNNPLIATIFPNLAELMALDQSSSIAVDHRLDRQGSADLQAEALDRAHRQEASTLFWDTDSEKYYLIHPTLSHDNSPATFGIEASREQIDIFAPPTFPSPSPSPSSTLTPTATSTPLLLSLSFRSLTTTIHPKPLAHLPSLYILDTLLATLATLLLHQHRSSPSPSPLTLAHPPYPPPPPHALLPPPRSLLSRLKSPKRSRSRSRATRPTTRPHDEESGPHIPLSPPPRAAAAAAPPPTSTSTSTFTFSFPTAAADPDEKLPLATRALLKVLGWVFRALVWALGIGIRALLAVARVVVRV